MLRYTYRCPKCEEHREVRHGMLENPHVVCECGASMVRRPCNLMGVWYPGRPHLEEAGLW